MKALDSEALSKGARDWGSREAPAAVGSPATKSLGEQPHQSTMCLYWHLQPSLRFQLVTRRLLSTRLSQAGLFSSTV